jgi:flagellar motility protein MotE (MotC chaperone)
MTLHIPAQRLLPLTIGVLAIVLVVKSTVLLRAAIASFQPTALIATAWASGPDTPAQTGKPSPPQATKPQTSADGKPASANPASTQDNPPAIDGPPPVSDSERAVLLELRDRRKELEAREATLAARESMVAAAEVRLSARVEELQGLQKKLEGLDDNHKQQEDAAWKGLVKVYEDMKPRDAAVIFNDLGMQVLLAVVDRMKEAKAAAILAAMTPDKAREVTMQLAQFRSRDASAAAPGDKPALQPAPAKAPGSGT